MKKNWLRRTVLLGLLSVSVLVSLAAQGTREDPLVTLGYLNEKFLPQVVEQVMAQTADREETLGETLQEKLDDYTKEMTRKINKLSGSGASGSEAAGFAVVTLEGGSALTPEVGCELMLREGTAVCQAAANPALVDLTAGTQLLGGGQLEVNHLYLVTDTGRTVSAYSETVTLLVRGGYTVS